MLPAAVGAVGAIVPIRGVLAISDRADAGSLGSGEDFAFIGKVKIDIQCRIL